MRLELDNEGEWSRVQPAARAESEDGHTDEDIDAAAEVVRNEAPHLQAATLDWMKGLITTLKNLEVGQANLNNRMDVFGGQMDNLRDQMFNRMDSMQAQMSDMNSIMSHHFPPPSPPPPPPSDMS